MPYIKTISQPIFRLDTALFWGLDGFKLQVSGLHISASYDNMMNRWHRLLTLLVVFRVFVGYKEFSNQKLFQLFFWWKKTLYRILFVDLVHIIYSPMHLWIGQLLRRCSFVCSSPYWHNGDSVVFLRCTWKYLTQHSKVLLFKNRETVGENFRCHKAQNTKCTFWNRPEATPTRLDII